MPWSAGDSSDEERLASRMPSDRSAENIAWRNAQSDYQNAQQFAQPVFAE